MFKWAFHFSCSLYILWVHPEKSAHENYLVILFLLVFKVFIFRLPFHVINLLNFELEHKFTDIFFTLSLQVFPRHSLLQYQNRSRLWDIIEDGEGGGRGFENYTPSFWHLMVPSIRLHFFRFPSQSSIIDFVGLFFRVNLVLLTYLLTFWRWVWLHIGSCNTQFTSADSAEIEWRFTLFDLNRRDYRHWYCPTTFWDLNYIPP